MIRYLPSIEINVALSYTMISDLTSIEIGIAICNDKLSYLA